MRRIALSAEGDVIDRARRRAAREKTTLNVAFRDWLARYGGIETTGQEYRALMKRLRRARAGRAFSRQEFNER